MTYQKLSQRRSLFFLIISSLIILVFIPSACGGKKELSRSKAKEMIVERLRFPRPVFIYLKFGQMVELETTMWDQFYRYWKDLEKRGWVTVKKLGQRRTGFVTSDVYEVGLTDAGKKIFALENGNWYKAKICDQLFLEITGIITSKELKQAQVEYTWKYGNFGEISKALPQVSSFLFGVIDDRYIKMPSLGDLNSIHQGKVVFTLYDDGWRID